MNEAVSDSFFCTILHEVVGRTCEGKSLTEHSWRIYLHSPTLCTGTVHVLGHTVL